MCASHAARQAHLLHDGERHHVLLSHARHGRHLLDHDMQAEAGADGRRVCLLSEADRAQEAQESKFTATIAQHKQHIFYILLIKIKFREKKFSILI